MKGKKIKIVLAEDHELMRRALISLLEEDNSIQVVGEAGNGKELLVLLKTVKPDIVLLDIEMPVMNGREALLLIKKKHPEVNVIILSMYDETSLVSDFIANGANAFLSKSASTDTLFKAIKAVKNSGSYFDNSISKSVLKTLLRKNGVNPHFGEQALSEREVDVLKQLCNGKTNKEIATLFSVSASTIDFHRTNIYRKTKSCNVTDLVKYAIKNAFINLD
ncbi:MAG TPA: response regulator transcription factor [Flavobacteriales bacterium]|nr:response regulator transcription factor [Flavobacteriales bacterium]